MSNAVHLISRTRLATQLRLVFEAWEMRPEYVSVCVDRMLEADLMGIDSHGIGMLPQYEENRRTGALVVNPTVETEKDLAAIALLDGGHGMGHIVATQAMKLAIQKTMVAGISLVSVRHSNHFGAAGVYSNLARREGLIGIATTGTTQRSVVPTFGKEPRFSTNPLAFAAPGLEGDGFSLDMATSTVAVGKLKIAKRAERPIPIGWSVNAEGLPETDPEAALASEPKRLTPLGGTRELGSHKGYGLAMMVEILSSVLSGSFIGGYDLETGSRGQYINVGHCFLTIDPAQVRGEGDAFGKELDQLTDYLRATPRADPNQPVLVPGDPERKTFARRLAEGIPLTDNLIAEVQAVTESCGARFMLSAGA